MRHFQVHDTARDVVTGTRLNDDILGDGDAANRNAITQMRIRHQVQTDDARVRRRLCGLAPQCFIGLGKQRFRQVRVYLGAHVTDLWQHVMCVRYFLYFVKKRHRPYSSIYDTRSRLVEPMCEHRNSI